MIDVPLDGGDAPTDLRLALERSEDRYRLLIDRAGYGIYRSSAGRFVEANPALIAMLGYSGANELRQLDVATDIYLDPADHDRVRQRAGERAGYTNWIETGWRRRDGTHITVRLSVRAVADATGVIGSYEGIVEDVTQHRRQEEIVRRSERMASLGTTLAGVAHELNNPLSAIIGFTQLLLTKSWPEQDRAAIEMISQEANRSAGIVRDLLALARDRSAERHVPIDMNEVITHIVRVRRYALETAGITCELRLDPSSPRVLGDRAQLEQIVLNLVNNSAQALRSAGSWGRITIRTRSEHDEVVFDIEDNGPGIPDAERSRIWDPFYTTKDDGEGTGLGLPIVRGIVVDHDGTITLEDRAVSSDRGATGARFIVRMPQWIGETDIDDAAPNRAARPLDVLVVFPSESEVGFIERFLASRGHAVLSATTTDSALRLADQNAFDAVLCDTSLAAHDGRRLVTALHTSQGCQGSRFILMHDASHDDSHNHEPPASDLPTVTRPFDVQALRRIIEGC